MFQKLERCCECSLNKKKFVRLAIISLTFFTVYVQFSRVPLWPVVTYSMFSYPSKKKLRVYAIETESPSGQREILSLQKLFQPQRVYESHIWFRLKLNQAWQEEGNLFSVIKMLYEQYLKKQQLYPENYPPISEIRILALEWSFNSRAELPLEPERHVLQNWKVPQ